MLSPTRLCCAMLLLVGCPSDPVGGGAGAEDIGGSFDVASDLGVADAGHDVPGDAGVDTFDPGPPQPIPSCVVFDPDAADPTEAVFDPDCVIDVAIEMAPAEWYELRHETRSILDVLAGDCMSHPPTDVFTWFEADVTVGDWRVEGAGIRKKGFLGSLSIDKPALKVRFDKFVDGQELSGMKRLTLNNMQQDPGLIVACLGYGLMAKAGIPAPRCNFARVTVNGNKLGLYAHVESIKKPFLRRHFTSDEGNLYEATLSDFRPGFLGTWEKKTNSLADDWSDIEAVVAALEVPDEELLAAVDAVVDLDAFLTHWAAEVLIADWDGYAGNLNNTYLYADPVDGRFRFIPWGVDAAFGPVPELAGVGVYIPKSVFAFGHLANRLYAHSEGRELYLARLLELLDTVWDEAAVVADIDRMLDLLLPHVPLGKRDEFEQVLSFRKSWVKERRGQIEAELFPAADDWPFPPKEPMCWVEAGSISGTFATSWETSGPNPFDTGTGTVTVDVVGIEESVGNVGSAARLGTHESMLGEAVVELLAMSRTGMYLVLRVVGPPETLEPNTTWPIDWEVYRGWIGYVLPLADEFTVLGALLDGTISFEEASTIPGDPVIGSLEASVITAP